MPASGPFTALGGLVLLVLAVPALVRRETAHVHHHARGAKDTEAVDLGGAVSAWQAFTVTDVLLATLAIAIVLLGYRRRARKAVATVFAGSWPHTPHSVVLRGAWRPLR